MTAVEEAPAQAARVAQLEKVVELARTVVRTSAEHTEARQVTEAIWLLDLALTTLDYPGATPGPHCAAVAQEMASPAVAQERTSRARWGAWRHLRTSIKED